MILISVLLVLVATPLGAHADPASWPNGEKVRLNLARGEFEVLHYKAKIDGANASPKALLIFGTGCGGWTYWEDNVACKLRDDGYEVWGIDFALYSQSDYDLNILQSDYQTIVQYGLKAWGNGPLPVIVGGWSTGAEQAVAVAGGPHPPAGLVGLLLVAPGGEGGYGTYATNYVYWSAPASKLFKLTDFAPKLSHLRIAQWHAQLDPLDSRGWLDMLSTPHREFDFDHATHDYRGACDDFLTALDKSVSWILQGNPSSPVTAVSSPAGAGASLPDCIETSGLRGCLTH